MEGLAEIVSFVEVETQKTHVMRSQAEVDAFVKQVELETRSKFVCSEVNRGFTDRDWQPAPTRRVYWKWAGGGDTGTPPIEFTGVPFVFVGNKRLGCYRGRDRLLAQKRRYAEERARRSLMEECTYKHRSVCSKKVGCPAAISVSKIAMFPKFKLSDDRERARQRTSRALRLALQRDPVVWELRFVVTHYGQHLGHDMDPERKKRRRPPRDGESETPHQKRARKAHLRKKCVALTKQLFDKTHFIDDVDRLRDLSSKLQQLLEDIAPFCGDSETKRASLLEKTVQRLRSKYSPRTDVCTASEVHLWDLHTVTI